MKKYMINFAIILISIIAYISIFHREIIFAFKHPESISQYQPQYRFEEIEEGKPVEK